MNNSFSNCTPSLAALVLITNELITVKAIQDVIIRIETVQDNFKNCIAILVGNVTKQDFYDFQILVTAKQLRLLHAPNLTVAKDLLIRYNELLSDTKRSTAQKLFFQQTEEDLGSASVARDVLNTAFAKMNIPQQDSDIIMEGFPSVAKIIHANIETLSNNSPADAQTIRKLDLFFHSETPML